MKSRLIALVSALFISAGAFAAQSPEEDVTKFRLLMGEDRWIQLHYFLQTGVESSRKNWDAKNGETKSDAYWSKDFYIRSSRIIVNGQVSKSVFFFAQTDDLKAGKSSSDDYTENTADGKNNLFTQDAYVQFKPADAFQLYAGLLALPFNRQNLQSQATTLGVAPDYLQIPLKGTTNNGRDTGVMLRGLLFAQHLEYRVGAFRGLDRQIVFDDITGQKVGTRNRKDMPRATGRLQINLLEAEDGYFYSGNYIGKKNIFAIGIGADYQPDVCDKDGKGSSYRDYYAFSGDISFDMGFGGGTAGSFQAGFVKGTNNPGEGLLKDQTVPSYTSYFSYYLEAGVLMADIFQPYAKFNYRKNSSVKNEGDVTYKEATAGLNYLINGHHANIRFEYTYPLGSTQDIPGEERGTVQFQIYM